MKRDCPIGHLGVPSVPMADDDNSDNNEWAIKQKCLIELLDRHGLDGVLLTRRDNFSWITCGKDNHVSNNTPVGVASILASRDGKRVCLANAIEAPRIAGQELAGIGIEAVSFPWFDGDAAKKAAGDVVGGR